MGVMSIVRLPIEILHIKKHCNNNGMAKLVYVQRGAWKTMYRSTGRCICKKVGLDCLRELGRPKSLMHTWIENLKASCFIYC